MTPEIVSSFERQRLEIAQILLEAPGCVLLDFDKRFTFSSGIQSPIKVDCEKLVQSPEHLKEIVVNLEGLIRSTFGDYRFFGGIVTGGAQIAEKLGERFNLPVLKVLGKKQDEQRKKLIGGTIDPNSKGIGVDDVFTTGENGEIGIREIREKGGLLLGLVVVFDYDFEAAKRRFRWTCGLNLWALSKFNHLLLAGYRLGRFDLATVNALKMWWEKTNQHLSGVPQIAKI